MFMTSWLRLSLMPASAFCLDQSIIADSLHDQLILERSCYYSQKRWPLVKCIIPRIMGLQASSWQRHYSLGKFGACHRVVAGPIGPCSNRRFHPACGNPSRRGTRIYSCRCVPPFWLWYIDWHASCAGKLQTVRQCSFMIELAVYVFAIIWRIRGPPIE